MRVKLVCEQVKVPLKLLVRAGLAGATLSSLIITPLLTAVQPLGPVTVTEYVPDALTDRMAFVELSSHRYEPPLDAVKLSIKVVQVSVPLAGFMVAVGATVLLSMVVVWVAVQPLADVTVTEYVPLWFTTAVPAVGF